MINQCRCCNGIISKEPVLQYKNMPKSAQFFPDEKEVAQEKGVDLDIYQCPHCGLIQILDEPVPYYREVIRATGFSEEMTQFRLGFFDKFQKEFSFYSKKMIEIGSGCGEYLEIMREVAIPARGIESRKESVVAAKLKDLDIIEGFIETSDYVIPGGPYDGFTIMNFLEHIPDPNTFLKGIANNLTENGVGVVEVPNLNMILEKAIFSEFISDHLMYFTKETLTGLLEKNGFEVISCEEIWYNYIISAKVRKRKPLSVRKIQYHREIIIKEIQDFIKKSKAKGRTKGKKIAVWGAGHQALAVLSLLGEAEISYVIDSAPFKQEKYTPATHIKTVSPEILKEGEIGCVIIMAAGYSDEIAEYMRHHHGRIKAVILRDYGIEEC